MPTLIPSLTYRVIRMPAGPGCHVSNSPEETRYVAVAWNYDHAQLMSTAPCLTYTLARAALDDLVSARGCALRWFDGEYECLGDGAQIGRVSDPDPLTLHEESLSHCA